MFPENTVHPIQHQHVDSFEEDNCNSLLLQKDKHGRNCDKKLRIFNKESNGIHFSTSIKIVEE